MTTIKNRIVKVLHVGVDNIGFGGRSVSAFNLTQNIDEEKVINDFLAFKSVKKEYEKRINSKKGKVIYIYNNNNFISKISILKKINTFVKETMYIKNNRYNIIHIHADTSLEAMKTIFIGKIAGVSNFVIHAHTTKTKDNRKFTLLGIKITKKMIKKSNYIKLACSHEAAEFMFGETDKVTILKNGIDIKKYLFNQEIRNKVRLDLSLNDDYVLGCVARFSIEKNHIFLLEILNEIIKIDKQVKLLLIGEGVLLTEIQNKVSELQLDPYVVFLGNRSDVNELLQAMDIFVLASEYEGFGIVNIEAQAAGLPCIISDGIPNDAKITKEFEFHSIKENPVNWAKSILKFKNSTRKNNINNLVDSEFDIKNSSKTLERIYLES